MPKLGNESRIGKVLGFARTVGMHVPLAQEENQLVLGKVRINLSEGHHVESQVPRGVPGVLPLVGHADNVAIEQVTPIRITTFLSVLWRLQLLYQQY